MRFSESKKHQKCIPGNKIKVIGFKKKKFFAFKKIQNKYDKFYIKNT